MKRVVLFAAASISIVLAFVLFVFPRMRADAAARLENILIREPFLKVKQGERHVHIMRIELVGLLANDPDCVENLAEISFASLDFSESDLESLSSLTHVTSMNFYCCKDVDSALLACRELPLVSVGFEATPFSPESIHLLGTIPTLKFLSIEQDLDRKLVDAIKLLPKSTLVKSSFPLDAYD